MIDKIQILFIILVLIHSLIGFFYSKELIDYPLFTKTKKILGIFYSFIVQMFGAIWVREAVKMEETGDITKENEVNRYSPVAGVEISGSFGSKKRKLSYLCEIGQYV